MSDRTRLLHLKPEASTIENFSDFVTMFVPENTNILIGTFIIYFIRN